MAALLTTIRDEVYAKILLKKSNLGYVYNDFILLKTWIPSWERQDEGIQSPGIMWIMPRTWVDTVNLTRNSHITMEYPIQIGYIRPVLNQEDSVTMDAATELIEQILVTLFREVTLPTFMPQRVEFLKDEQLRPYHFTQLRQSLVWETNFTVYYRTII